MNRIPIAFSFDNNLVQPASVCLYSLLASAKPSTAYDIYILHHRNEKLDKSKIERVITNFQSSTLTFREVGDEFDSSFEIRGITTPAYYRLLIPELIPEHDRIIYSDVDVIFRQDLKYIYDIEIGDNYLGGVNALANFDNDLKDYYTKLGLNPSDIIYSGNLIINSAKFRNLPNWKSNVIKLARCKLKFQDMDIINILCNKKIAFLPPSFCLTTYINRAALYDRENIEHIWSSNEIDEALQKGIIHYNGQKPWKGYCPNFDVWWEYYRKSPVFDNNFYFDFYNSRLDELDRLSLFKRIKILTRYFVYGKKS